jgi:hypothetical protein
MPLSYTPIYVTVAGFTTLDLLYALSDSLGFVIQVCVCMYMYVYVYVCVCVCVCMCIKPITYMLHM